MTMLNAGFTRCLTASVLLPLALAGTAVAESKGTDAFRLSVDSATADVASLPRSEEADGLARVRVTPELQWRPAAGWEVKASATLEGTSQSGRQAYDSVDVIAQETYVRYRRGDTRLTAGWQTVVWARADETPVIDRVSRIDISRLWLDSFEQRRLPLPALRWEQQFEATALDVVLLPGHRGARLPDERSVWYPVRQTDGAIAGLELTPQIAAFVRAARLTRDANGSGGLALRWHGELDGGIAWGLVAARTRQSLPFFVADPVAGTLQETHPNVRFVGADAEWSTGETTWRTELGLSWDAPVTSRDGRAQERKLIEWVGGTEFFPGDGDLRVSVQALARSIRSTERLLERREYFAISGDLEMPLDKGRWKIGLRFNSALNVSDSYVAPRVVFAGWEPHEIHLSAHLFNGEPGTLSGFHRNNDVVMLGINARF